LNPPWDSGWSAGDENFSWSPPDILDHKIIDVTNPGWLQSNPGDIIDDFFQTNKMVLKDCAGNDVEFVFAERHFQKQNIGPGAWKLILL
jgi:hypothetical protein